MANSLIEGPIPLGGPGFIAKENGNFQPGEYKRLCNLEIDRSNFLVNRRNMYSVHGQTAGAAVTPRTNPQRFLGHMGPYTLLATDTNKQYIAGNGTFVEAWNDLSAGPTTGSSFSRFVGFFRYNNRNHWLVLEFNVGVSIGLAIYRDTAIPTPDVPSTYAPGYHTSLTRTVLFTFAAGTNDFYEFQFKNFFIYKERLWIATSVGLYFSKATDPTVFAVPNGGFFKYPGNYVNWAFAIKDNVYVLTDNSVHAITYATDPNLDATQRPLSDTIGGEMGCVHLDTPYFINNLGIFAINGQNVDKVMDSRFDYGGDTYQNRIASFEEYLVVNKYQPINYDNNYSLPNRGGLRTNLWLSPESDTVGGTQIDDNWTTSNSPTITRTNLIPNPSLESNLTGWYDGTVSTPTTIGRSTTEKFVGSYAGYIVRDNNSGSENIRVNTDYINIDALGKYRASVYVRTPVTRDVKLSIHFDTSPVAPILRKTISTTTSVQGGTWTRLDVQGTAGTIHATVYLTIEYQSVGGTSNHYWDAALLEKFNEFPHDTYANYYPQPYFDGNTTDTSYITYDWAGTVNNSASTAVIKTQQSSAAQTAADGQPGRVFNAAGTITDIDILEHWWERESLPVWGKWTYTLTPSTVTAGIPYTFRFDHRAAQGISYGSLTLLVEYLDNASVVLGSYNTTVSSDYNVSASYSTFTTSSLTPPTGTTKFRFTFTCNMQPDLGPTSWAVYMNRFHLEKGDTYAGYFTGASTSSPTTTYSWTGTAYASTSTASPDTHGYLKNNGSNFEPFLGGNTLGYNTYFINTENGSTHVVDFTDQYVSYNHGSAGFIVDMITNPLPDDSGNYKILFLTNKAISEGASGHTYKGNVYFMSSSEDTEVNDYSVDSSNVLRRRAPKIDVEIDSFVPDGFEYRQKKYRSLLVHGIMPPTGMQFECAYDNNAAVLTATMGDNEVPLTNPRRHYAHRIGLNQRGRSLTIRLRNPGWLNALSAEYGDLEISDLRVMWTYTQRLPTTKNIGS